MSQYKITFITPLFSRGAYEDSPEIRPSSIRGQLHWWFRALGGSYANEKAIFGGVQKGTVASKVVIRVSSIEGDKDSMKNTLPHKSGRYAVPKKAYCPGTSFHLHVLERLGGLEGTLKTGFERALKAWLLLGTLGLRSTRAAGSFIWEPLDDDFAYPQTFEEYEKECQTLLNGVPTLKFALLNKEYSSSEEARKDVSDTLGGSDERNGQNDLARINYPLGKVFGGRKTSPLRFRIVKIGDIYRIAAVWDNRREVTRNTEQDLNGIIELLNDKKRDRLGSQLINSSLYQN